MGSMSLAGNSSQTRPLVNRISTLMGVEEDSAVRATRCIVGKHQVVI